jgi:hypothetical protein
MDNQLRQFNGDIHTKEAVLTYCVEFFERQLINRAYEGKDVKSLADAVQELKGAFEQLSIDYGIKQPPKEIIDHSR